MRIVIPLIIILLSVFSSAFSSGEKSAANCSSNIPEFYAGVSVGWEHLTTKRTEQLKTYSGKNLFFSSNKSQATNGLNAKGLLGFLWSVPTTSFVISPEIYFGQGSAQATIQAGQHDPDTPADKNLQSTLKHSFTMGLVLRAGFYLTSCSNNFLYGVIGVDKSKFESKSILSSADVLGTSVPALFEKRSKFLKGTIVGLGFERKFNGFKVGIDMRYTAYPSWSYASRKNSVSDDTLSVRLKPKIFLTSLTLCYLF